MKEAMLYEKLGDGRVKCGVCPHHCVIAEGKRGICAVRENREGTLYALNYGKAIAIAIDPIEKKPLNHFLPGTTAYSFATIGCNLRCLWCQNWATSQASKPDRPIYGEDISPEEHVRRALAAGCPSIAYTYTEPIIFVEYALDTMKLAREAGLKNIWKTAGHATKETLDTIIRFHESGVHLEIATLVVPGVNDRIDQLERMARFIAEEVGKEVPWHVNRFFPSWKMMDTAITPMETLETAAALGKKIGLLHVHIGNV